MDGLQKESKSIIERVELLMNGEMYVETSEHRYIDRYIDDTGVFAFVRDVFSFGKACLKAKEYALGASVGVFVLENTENIKLLEYGYLEDSTDLRAIARDMDIEHLYNGFILDLAACYVYLYGVEDCCMYIYGLLRYSWWNIAIDRLKFRVRGIDMDLLIRNWYAYVASLKNFHTCVVEDALKFVEEKEYAFYVAHTYAAIHPELYLRCIERFGIETEEELNALMNVLTRIDESYTNRYAIALHGATLALLLENEKITKKCWLYAFQAKRSLENFLRILFEGNDCVKQARKMYKGKKTTETMDSQVESMSETLSMICFFDGDLKTLMDADGAVNEVTLYLLMLYMNHEDKFMDGVFARIPFSSEEYAFGTLYESSEVSLKSLFHQWVERFGDVYEAFDISTIVECSMKAYIESILGKCPTDMYVKCASLVVIYDQMLGSNGSLVEQYALLYKRYPRFVRELKSLCDM